MASAALSADPRWGAAGWGATLIGVVTMSVIYAPQPLVAEIAREFGRTASEANLIVSATTLGIAIGVFPMAWASARIGRSTVIGAALVVAPVLTVVTAVADSWWLIVASRLAVGVLVAGILVSVLVWATEAVPREHSRRVAALYIAGTTGGGMLGRLVSGLVAEVGGWRIGVLAVDALVVAGAVAGILLVSAHDRRMRSPVDDRPDERVEIGIDTSRRAPLPMRMRLFALGFLGTAVFVGVFAAIVFRMLEPPFELGVGITSLLFLSYLAGTWSSVQAGILVDRWGLRVTIVCGVTTTAIGVLLTAIDSIPAVVAGLLVMAAGFFVVHTVASSALPAMSPVPTRASAVYTVLFYLGSSVGAVLLGVAWDRWAWIGVVLAAMALLLGSVLVAAGIPRGDRFGQGAVSST